MRHQNKGFKLGRTSAHREATLAALSSALIERKRIRTTVTKAKALRMYVEPLITRSKDDTTHNRREVFRHLQNKRAVTELFAEVATKIGDRPGGYTRVVKLGARPGDAAEMAIIELVDYNESAQDETSSGRSRRTRRGGRRGRRGGQSQQAAATTSNVEGESVDTDEATATVEEPVTEEATSRDSEQTEPQAETKDAAKENADESAEDSDEGKEK